MAVDMRARYFGEFDEGAMPSFGVLPQAAPQPSAFEVAPIMDTPRQAAVMPMTTEAVAPNYLSGLNLSDADLASLYALSAGNAGGATSAGIGGLPSLGDLGANYVDTSGAQLITAPISNKGNPTAYGADNQFYIQPNELVRVVDRGTNSVIFEGVGPDAAREAVKIGQNLTDTMGRKADYQIQAGLTPDRYVPVANEKFNKTDLQNIANAVGTVAPLAAAFIPGLNLGVLGSIGAGAGLGGVSAGLKGDNILKGAAMGGLSAAGGQLLGPMLGDVGNIGLRAGTAIGTGLGATAGGLLTGQNLKDALTGGVVSGGLSYISPDITKGLGIGGGSSANTSTGGGGGGEIVVSGYRPTSIGTSLGGSQNKIQQALKPRTETPYDGLTVTGGRVGGTFGVNLGGDRFGAPGSDTSAFEKMYSEPYDPNEILVKATPATQTSSVAVPVTGGLSSDVLDGIAEFEKNPIVAEGSKIEQATPGGFTIPQTDLEVLKKVSDMETEKKEDIVVTGTDKTTPVAVTVDTDLGTKSVTDTLPKLEADPELADKKKLSVADALALLKLADGLVGGGGSGGGGGGAAGSQAINPIFSAKLPTPGAGGAFKVGGLDYTTPPARSAADMYRYAMGPAMDIPAGMDLRGATSPYAGYGPGTLGEETFKRVTGMAHGGAMGYARGSSRDSFAVEGPGTGRSDDIPAVLSDGEYVIDAETVALLGDGSSKAGAKKLDEMRVKVRKHKGRNLAKGKFSANAKRPEKYLSGGRT
jgi:hypothetical protein